LDRQTIQQRQKNESQRIDPSIILALSLFVILLAFFIVLNAISNYSEPKVGAAFESLDNAFSTKIVPTFDLPQTAQTDNQNLENQDGGGDSIEDIQGVLRSILPGIDSSITETPNGGVLMAIRMKKDQFDKLSNQLIPLFIRILNLKDKSKSFNLEITSYVQNVFSDKAVQSFEIASQIKNEFLKKGLAQDRLVVKIENGNPAYFMFSFNNIQTVMQ
jgi:hypothetical protein